MSHNTNARDEIIELANAVLATLTTAMPGGGAMREHLAEIIAEAESMTLDDDPPTYDGEPVSPKSESPREQLRRACIDLTRLADELGWEWSIESCDAGGGRWVYRIEVDGLKEGGG